MSLLLATAGCSFNVNGTGLDAAGGADLAMGGDLADPPDMANPPVCTPGTKVCSSGMLSSCRTDGSGFDVVTCKFGCNIAGDGCQQLYATAPVQPSDFKTAMLTAQTVAAGFNFDTGTGEVRTGPTVLRMPNDAPIATYQVKNGIGFRLAAIPGGGTLAIWSFSSLTVNAGIALTVTGPNPLAWVSNTDITLNGTVDATCGPNIFVAAVGGTPMPYLGGPGGGSGGTTASPAKGGGDGGGASAAGDSGGGGASYSNGGGIGGDDGTAGASAAGATYGGPTLSPLRGGSGGGKGSGTSVGGGGGGAVQLVAQDNIIIGAGAMKAGINVGGCGGQLGGNSKAGGGGGSGGAILLEAQSIQLGANAVLAANGGGGAGGDTTISTMVNNGNGQTGPFDMTRAIGGVGGASGGSGGRGGATGTMTGTAGEANKAGGGGGGGAGRIRLNSRTGAAATTAGFIISPPDPSTATSQGTVDIH